MPAARTRNTSDSGIKIPWVGVFVISGCALGYELLLIRLLGIVQWYHYGYMIISLALLGHGASGTFIAIFQERLLPRYRAMFLVNGVLFAASAVTCFLIAQHIPFNNLAMLWDGRQWLWLALIFLLLLIPFLLAANCIGLTLCRFNRSIPRIYACDLLGAALGAAAAVLALYVLHPLAALLACSIIALFAFAHTAWTWFPDRRFHWMILGLGLVLFGLPQSWVTLHPAAYKPLSKALLLPETRIEGNASSPLGMLQIVSSPVIPFRHAPGLSINSRNPIPEQLGIFNDGGEFDALSKHGGDRDGFAYLEDMLSALPYRVLENPSVLLLGLGGGDGFRQAARLGASQIDVVEFDARRTRLVLEDFVDYAAWSEFFPQPRVLQSDPRAHLSGSAPNYDLIRLEIPGAQSLSSLRPEYRLTRQAFDLYLDSLTPEGILAAQGAVELPPRSALRTLATVAESLKHRDLDPAQHVVFLRNWSAWIILVSNRPWEAARISTLQRFSRELAFDTAYFPGIAPGESNTFNRIADDTFHLAAEALLGAEPSNFIERYKFRIAPASDDRPHFYQFLTWQLAWEWLSLRDRGGMALMDDGFPVLLATLAQAALVSVVLIVLPLVFYKSSARRNTDPVSSLSLFAYFFLVGLAFIAIEIAVIQKLVLLLSHPGFSIPLAIAAFLLFAGLGSLWVRRYPPGSSVPVVACGVAATVSVLFLLLNPVIPQLMSLPVTVRALLALLLTAPLGFVMGMPFPAALELVASRDVGRLPWCWAINGCASVLSAVSSMALAILFGYSVTIIIAAALYLAAIPAVRRISAAT